MADGKIFGAYNQTGQIAHTDGTAQTTVQIAIPTTPDAVYAVHAVVACYGAGGAAGIAGQLTGKVHIDGGALTVSNITWTGDVGGTGYSATLDISAGFVRVRTTAANLQRSVARIEAFGVEMAITGA